MKVNPVPPSKQFIQERPFRLPQLPNEYVGRRFRRHAQAFTLAHPMAVRHQIQARRRFAQDRRQRERDANDTEESKSNWAQLCEYGSRVEYMLLWTVLLDHPEFWQKKAPCPGGSLLE